MHKGFTLIELLVTMALIAILVGTYFLVANPAGQLAASRNSERTLNLDALMNAIRQNIADQSNEKFLCAAGSIPATSTPMSSAAGSYDIAPCLVSTYLFSLPFDPSAPDGHYASVSDYDTGYNISVDASGTITLSAPFAELGKTISVSG